MNPYDAAMATMKAIGDIFRFIGKAISFIFTSIGKILNVFIDITRSICNSIGIMGLSSPLLKIVLSGLVSICVLSVLSLIPDLITYLCCRLSKNYRKLNTKEEKREYTSKHTHFLLKLFLSMHNNSLRRKAIRIAKKTAKNEKKMAKKEEKVSKKEVKKAKEIKKTESVVDEAINEVLNDESAYCFPTYINFEDVTDKKFVSASPVREESLPTMPAFLIPSKYAAHEESDFPTLSEPSYLDEPTETFESNIKILYSSDIVGKMLRKGVVLDRRMSHENQPVLIDFTDKPKEIFTGHLCDSESGIRVKKHINGEMVEYVLDNPEILNNPQILESINDKETLEALRTRLQNDIRYQTNMKKFFNIHDKAMVKVKEINR